METSTNHKARLIPSTRFGVVLLWFYGAISFYMIRMNFSISIVCMTVDTENDTAGNQTFDEQCEEVSQETKEPYMAASMLASLCGSASAFSLYADIIKTGEFEWERLMRGLLNSSFYFGYILTHIPGGILAQKYGPKWVHFGGLAFATVFSLLSPISAEGGPWVLFAVRVLLGFASGCFVPAMRCMLSNWSPLYEKSILYTVQSAGYSIGSVVAFSLTGLLCDSLGWKSTFYIPSLFPISYLMVYIFLVSDGPEQHRCISEKEKDFIVRERSPPTQQDITIPWKSIFTSVPCWALFVTEFCSAWGGYTVLTSGTQYMKDVLNYDIKANGGFNALPQLCKFVFSIFGGIIVDIIRKKGILSTTNCRKLAQTIGMLVPASMMIGLGFMNCDNRAAAVAMLCISEGFGGLVRAGISVNVMELAPRFVPILGGIMNTFSTASGTICPVIASLLTQNGSREEWQMVFFIGAAIYVFGWLLFVIFTNAREQPWAKAGEDRQVTFSVKNKEIWHSDGYIESKSFEFNQGYTS